MAAYITWKSTEVCQCIYLKLKFYLWTVYIEPRLFHISTPYGEFNHSSEFHVINHICAIIHISCMIIWSCFITTSNYHNSINKSRSLISTNNVALSPQNWNFSGKKKTISLLLVLRLLMSSGAHFTNSLYMHIIENLWKTFCSNFDFNVPNRSSFCMYPNSWLLRHMDNYDLVLYIFS